MDLYIQAQGDMLGQWEQTLFTSKNHINKDEGMPIRGNLLSSIPGNVFSHSQVHCKSMNN